MPHAVAVVFCGVFCFAESCGLHPLCAFYRLLWCKILYGCVTCTDVKTLLALNLIRRNCKLRINGYQVMPGCHIMRFCIDIPKK